jgi:putative glutamine amidotransferase
MAPAIIGITTGRTSPNSPPPQTTLSESYSRAVSQAGGIPLLIPLGLSDTQLKSLSARLDGILFSGGGDIDPAEYGLSCTPQVKNIDPDRDRLEIQLVRLAVSAGLPFLGICRGLQVINVALGGTLYLDVHDQHPNALKHDYFPDWPRQHLAHGIQIEAHSRLARILENTLLPVNSLHHQGIQHLAPGFQVTAFAPDGLIESIDLSDHPFGLAVQWHPECLPEHPPMKALFAAFVAAAAGESHS